ncbi:MAG: asparaginase [Dongiaceae bacterium]
MSSSPSKSLASFKSDATANPFVVEVTRGGMVESRHRAAVAVVDAGGKVARAWGDVEQPVYGRSAIKPLQALPLIESGAADKYNVSVPEIALACASHNGEPRHVELVQAWLSRIGCAVGDLECGGHMPYHDASVEAMIRAGIKPSAAYNNCSGKHTGFLCTARHLGERTAGYINFEHPVQQRILGTLEQMCGLDLGKAARGIDGCGIPVIAVPLGNMAMAMARLVDTAKLPPARAAASKRIVDAMAAEPFLVAGTDRFCTQIMDVVGKKVVLKTGAEGVYTASLRELGLGIALKADDGASRGAETAMGQLLRHLGVITDEEAARLADILTPPVRNRVGRETGRVKPAADSPF